MNKTLAFIMSLAAITLFGLAALVFPDKMAAEPLKAVLTAIVSLATAYIGLQVANNGVRGKFFNQALYDSDHSREEENHDGTK